jgi:hypothetical protein
LRLVAIHQTLVRSDAVRAFVLDAGLVEHAAAVEPPMRIFENPHALPRAFTVYRVRPAPPREELLARLSDPSFDPLVESYVEDDPGFTAAPDASARGSPAVFVRDEERVVELDATRGAAGLLVLADSFYPGWRATVDGARVSIVATNHLFRGVPVPAGHHRVRFEYRPRSIILGAVLSLAATASVVALLVTRRERLTGCSRGSADAA